MSDKCRRCGFDHRLYDLQVRLGELDRQREELNRWYNTRYNEITEEMIRVRDGDDAASDFRYIVNSNRGMV